jgi:hypothetical protein
MSHKYYWAYSIPLAEFLGKFLGPFNDIGRISQGRFNAIGRISHKIYWAHSIPFSEFPG